MDGWIGHDRLDFKFKLKLLQFSVLLEAISLQLLTPALTNLIMIA